MAIRLVESAAVGALCGSGIALLLMPILIYRGQPGGALAAVALGVGTLAGLAWAGLRLPTRLGALMRADAQARLDDLLSTAWLLRRQARDEMADAVMASANSAAAGLSASTIALGRLGRRSWSFIILCCALSGTLAMIAANPLEPRGMASAHAQDGRPSTLDAKGLSNRNGQRLVAFNPITPSAPDHPGAADAVLNPGTPAHVADPARANPVNGGASAADPDGTGSGSGRSDPTHNPGSIDPVAGPGSTTRPGQGNASGGAFSKSPIIPISPWAAPGWPAAQEAAASAVREGAVPTDYHPLLRDYFGI